MLKHKDHFHGSDLEKIEELYGIKKESIVSFSANVNPLGISPKLRSTLVDHIDAITTYPDREYTALRSRIGEYVNAPAQNILVGNGSTELISLYYPLKEENDFLLDVEDFKQHLNEDLDLLVICNPNNPTSTAVVQKDMRRILDECKRHDIFVIVDETYVEFAPDVSAVDSIPLTRYYNNLVILRGVSKFFAAPGLRLGYAVTGNGNLLADINSHKNPWTINSLAAVAGELMFTDTDYIHRTRELIEQERSRVYQELSSWDSLKVYKPTANFILARIEKEGVTADDLFDHAIRKGLMIRNCSTFPFLDNRYFRFCFMLPEKNTELLNCLSEMLQQ